MGKNQIWNLRLNLNEWRASIGLLETEADWAAWAHGLWRGLEGGTCKGSPSEAWEAGWSVGNDSREEAERFAAKSAEFGKKSAEARKTRGLQGTLQGPCRGSSATEQEFEEESGQGTLQGGSKVPCKDPAWYPTNLAKVPPNQSPIPNNNEKQVNEEQTGISGGWTDLPIPDIANEPHPFSHEVSQLTYHAIQAWGRSTKLKPSKSLTEGAHRIRRFMEGNLFTEFDFDPDWILKNHITRKFDRPTPYPTAAIHRLIDLVAERMKASGFTGDPPSLADFILNQHTRKSSLLRYLNMTDARSLPQGQQQGTGSDSNPPEDSPRGTSALLPTRESQDGTNRDWQEWLEARGVTADPEERQEVHKILEDAYNQAKDDNRAPHPKVFWERAVALAHWHGNHLETMKKLNIHFKEREAWNRPEPPPFGHRGEFLRSAKTPLRWFKSILQWMQETNNGAWLPAVGSSEWEAFVGWMKKQHVQLIEVPWEPPTEQSEKARVTGALLDFRDALTESLRTWGAEPDEGRRHVKALWDIWNTRLAGDVADMALSKLKDMAQEDNPGGWMARTCLETMGVLEPA